MPVAAADDFAIDLEAVERVLGPRTSALILNTPCNPSGHVATGEELRGLAALLERHRRRHGRRIVLLVDEVYHRLVYPPAHHVHPFAVYPATAIARSFSKDLGLAGERIGYLALHPELAGPEVMRGLELCQRALGFVNAPATMQRMLVHLPSLDVDLAPYLERRDLTVALAADAGLEIADLQGGLYAWVRVHGEDTLALAAALARRRVLVAPGIAFGSPGWLDLLHRPGRRARARDPGDRRVLVAGDERVTGPRLARVSAHVPCACGLRTQGLRAPPSIRWTPSPAPAPQGWSVGQPPPPPQWSGGQWNSVPLPMTPERRRRMWDGISMGLGGGALYFGIGALAAAAIAVGFYHIPVTTTRTGVTGAVDHAVARFVLDVFAVMFGMMGLAGGAIGGVLGLVGLITRRVAIAALCLAGLACSAGGFALAWYMLATISNGHPSWTF